MPIVHTSVIKSFQSFCYYYMIASFKSGILWLVSTFFVFVFVLRCESHSLPNKMNEYVDKILTQHRYFAYTEQKDGEPGEKRRMRCKNRQCCFYLLNRLLNFLKENRSKSITIELNVYACVCLCVFII